MNHILDTEYTNRCQGCGLLWSLVGPPEFKNPRVAAMFKECKPRNWKPVKCDLPSEMRRIVEESELLEAGWHKLENGAWARTTKCVEQARKRLEDV